MARAVDFASTLVGRRRDSDSGAVVYRKTGSARSRSRAQRNCRIAYYILLRTPLPTPRSATLRLFDKEGLTG